VSAFVDTSALYALLVRDDRHHRKVAAEFGRLVQSGRALYTSNYVLIETVALLQSRYGLAAVRDVQESILPLLRVHWVREETHRRAMDRLLREDRRQLSLVDCTSFLVMEGEGIRDALAIDPDFDQAGFRTLP
jgi:predicted nucleic acid-binding protein